MMKPRKVSVVWSDGSITEMQSVNALRIAMRWLQIRPEVLAVYAADMPGAWLYLKER